MPVHHQFTIAPPLRCDFRSSPDDPLPCGAPAVAVRFAQGELPCAFRCATHVSVGDSPVPESYVCRRVTIHADVLFAGVTLGLTLAKAEAVARLELAVAQAGGLLNLHGADSEIGRYSPPAPPPARRPVLGRV